MEEKAQTQELVIESQLDESWPKQGVNYVTKPEEEEKKEVVSDPPAVTEEKKEPAQSSFDETAWLKEKTGGKFEKWEDVWSKVEAQPELKFENDQSKTVYEYLQKGETGKVTEFLVLQQTLSGLKEASDEQVIKMRMRIEEPDTENIDAAFDVDFEKPEKGEMSEDQYEKAMNKYNRSLKKRAEEARSFLEERKAELILPPTQGPTVDHEAELKNEVTKSMQEIHESVLQALPQVNEFAFTFNNDKGIELNNPYKFTEQDTKEAGEALKDYGEFFNKRYTTDGGGYDGTKLLNDVLLLNNYHRIMESMVTQAVMNDRLKSINDRTNYSAGREIVAPPATDANALKAEQDNKAKMQEIWNV